MITGNLLPQTVTINTRSQDETRDAYGNQTTSTTSSTVVRGRLQQQTSVELVDGRDVVTDTWRLYLSADVSLTADDEVVEGTRRFIVDGTPSIVWGASAPHHIEATLRYVEDVP